MHLEAPRRHVEASCSLISLIRSGLRLGQSECQSAIYCWLKCSVQLHLLLIPGSAIAHTSLASSMRRSLPDVCSMLKAGVGHQPSGNIASTPAAAALAWPTLSHALSGSSGRENRRACPSWPAENPHEVMSVVTTDRLFSGHQWLLFLESSKTPVASMVPTRLWPCKVSLATCCPVT